MPSHSFTTKNKSIRNLSKSIRNRSKSASPDEDYGSIVSLSPYDLAKDMRDAIKSPLKQLINNAKKLPSSEDVRRRASRSKFVISTLMRQARKEGVINAAMKAASVKKGKRGGRATTRRR